MYPQVQGSREQDGTVLGVVMFVDLGIVVFFFFFVFDKGLSPGATPAFSCTDITFREGFFLGTSVSIGWGVPQHSFLPLAASPHRVQKSHSFLYKALES